jgi:hypothetical protein
LVSDNTRRQSGFGPLVRRPRPRIHRRQPRAFALANGAAVANPRTRGGAMSPFRFTIPNRL